MKYIILMAILIIVSVVLIPLPEKITEEPIIIEESEPNTIYDPEPTIIYDHEPTHTHLDANITYWGLEINI